MKKLKQRLLSMILVVLMVAGMLPVEQMAMIEAADNTTIYLHATCGTAPYTAKLSGNGSVQDVVMEQVAADYYSVTVPAGKTTVMFVDTNGKWLANGNNWPVIPTDGRNCFEPAGFGQDGWSWSTYTASESGTTTETRFYVQTDLVDFLNNYRVISTEDQHTYRSYNQGNQTSGNDSPFYLFNRVISNYAQRKQNPTPLYVGPLYLIGMRYGRDNNQDGSKWYSLYNWNTGANVAPAASGGVANYSASAQNLVGKELINGELVDVNGNVLPYFSKELANTLKTAGDLKVMEYYSGLEFPFKTVYDSATDSTTYSYDSLSDYAVYYNYSDKKLQESSTHVKNLQDKQNGFYPLNESDDSGDEVNMGFGTKFTIPFTVNDNGTINGLSDGEAVTFEFTGDDDVWVFIDDQLVLDMGGAHTKASGSINFKNLTATVTNAYNVDTTQTRTSGNTWQASCYTGLGNWLYENDTIERDVVSSGSETVDFPSELKTVFEKEYQTNTTKVHTLTMFYMERGMFDSNMSISFTMNPIPSGLALSKTLDTSEINEGLRSVVQEIEEDSFSFEIKTKDLEDSSASYEVIEDVSYSLNDYNNKDKAGNDVINGIVTGVGARSFAHTFVKEGTTSEAFKAETGFQITELTNTDTFFQYDYENDTKWSVYNQDNNYLEVTNGKGCVAEFEMSDNDTDDDFDRYNYSVNFKNKPLDGTLTLKKEWDAAQTAPANGTYSFTIYLDLNNDGEYETYDLEYTSDKGTTGTAKSGVVSLSKDETVTFAGIPQGVSYKIVENIVDDAGYSSNQTDNTVTGTIPVKENSTEESVVNIVFTNRATVGTLTLTKAWKDGQTAPENGEYTFTVMINGTSYANKAYTSSVDGRSGTTDEEGKLTLINGETVTFNNISENANYTITENISENAGYSSDKTDNTVTGTIVAAETSKVIFTNTFNEKTIDKVIYVEAGKEDGTDYTVTDHEDNDAMITVSETSSVSGVEITPYTDGENLGKVNVKSDNPNKKYEVTYEGTKSDGTIVTGTITVLTYKATNDIYVFDYGLKSNLSDNSSGYGLFANDILFNDNDVTTSAKLNGLSTSSKGIWEEEVENEQSTLTCTTGVGLAQIIENSDPKNGAVIQDENSQVWYEPTSYLDKKEITYYQTAVLATGKTEIESAEDGVELVASITTMPANSVYYEDNFQVNSSGIQFVVAEGNKNSSENSSVNDDEITRTQSNDQSENYGHEDTYSEDSEYSNGSATVLHNGDTATFTFKGTGFDIISRTNNDTAGIGVKVFEGTSTSGTPVKTLYVDTYYSNGDLYQVPVITVEDLEADTYTVQLFILDTYTGQTTVYIDGIRIYNPLDDTRDYLESEQKVTIKEVRDMLFGEGYDTDEPDVQVDPSIDLVALEGEEYVLGTGATVIEAYNNENGYVSATSDDLENILTSGPNNELYLPYEGGIAFKVNKPEDDTWTLQIGAKSVGENTGIDEETEEPTVVEKELVVFVRPHTVAGKGTFFQIETIKLNTSTDMYYDINLMSAIEEKNWKAPYYDILLFNGGELADMEFISLTNLKYGSGTTVGRVSSATKSVEIVSLEGYGQLENVEAIIEAKFNVSSVTRSRNVLMTITTIADVEDITVYDPDGNAVANPQKSKTTDANGNLVWTVSFKAYKTKTTSAEYKVDAVINGKETGNTVSAYIRIK